MSSPRGPMLTKYENLNMNEWATVSSDDIKEMLAEKGYVPEVEGLTPMESSTLVHEESSYLADRLLSELSKQGKNIIYDFTCKKTSSALRRMGVLTDNGYKYEDMQFVYVDIDPNTAKLRAKNRYLQGLNQGINTAIENKYLDEQKKIIGGRYLPEHIIDGCKPKGNKYSSVNAENIIELHNDKSMNLPRPKIYNNMGSEPVAIDYDKFVKQVFKKQLKIKTITNKWQVLVQLADYIYIMNGRGKEYLAKSARACSTKPAEIGDKNIS